MKNWLLYFWSPSNVKYLPCFSGTWDSCFMMRSGLKYFSGIDTIIVPSW